MIYKCRNCGANAVYSPEKGTMYCPYCDSQDSEELAPGGGMAVCMNCGGELKPGDYMKPGADHFGPGADQRFRVIPLERFMREERSRRDAVPYILNVSKGNLDRYIEDNFDEIADAVKDCGIACGNLGWIKAFQSRGIKVYGDYGLNVFNEQAAKAFAEAGVEVIAGSDELSMDGMHVDGGLLREPEIMRRVPLMITEHPLKMKYLTDRKGVRHEVLEWYSKDKYLLF